MSRFFLLQDGNFSLSPSSKEGTNLYETERRLYPMNKKHYLARPAAAALSLTMLWSAVSAASFSDIQGHWAADYINRAAAAGWISSDSTWCRPPEASVSRPMLSSAAASVPSPMECSITSEC